jgi:hypothetical protein
MKLIFDQDEMQILVSIIAFWFGTQAFNKKWTFQTAAY